LYVDHIRLAMHFVAAMILACYTLWFALMLLVPEEKRAENTRLSNLTYIILLLLFVQLTYGAFMAGLKAAMAAPTWPSINGMAVPDNLYKYSLVSDKINVHFMHRGIAYVLLALIVWWFFVAGKVVMESEKNSLLEKTRQWPMILVLAQVVLGIITV